MKNQIMVVFAALFIISWLVTDGDCLSGPIPVEKVLKDFNQETLYTYLCDVRFVGCFSALTLIKCASLRWTNGRIIDGAIRNNSKTEWD